MKLLRELSESAQILTESVGEQKRMYIAGPFLMFDKPNRNGRVYPQKVMDEAVANYDKDFIKRNRALGEMNHPPGRLQVDPERACIMTTELKKDGNYYYGKAKVLSTPLGKVLESLLSDGVTVGVSSRGAGSLSNQGKNKIVQPGYVITTSSDVVFDPSVGDAFVEHLMEEKEYILVGDQFVEEDMFKAQQMIKKAKMHELQEAKINAFQTFISKIKNV